MQESLDYRSYNPSWNDSHLDRPRFGGFSLHSFVEVSGHMIKGATTSLPPPKSSMTLRAWVVSKIRVQFVYPPHKY